jgi:hypothetical protein
MLVDPIFKNRKYDHKVISTISSVVLNLIVFWCLLRMKDVRWTGGAAFIHLILLLIVIVSIYVSEKITGKEFRNLTKVLEADKTSDTIENILTRDSSDATCACLKKYLEIELKSERTFDKYLYLTSGEFEKIKSTYMISDLISLVKTTLEERASFYLVLVAGIFGTFYIFADIQGKLCRKEK